MIGRAAPWLSLAVLCVAGWGGARSLAVDLARPLSVRGGTYVGSDACRRCHPGEHASWRRTYHRTMTRDADAASVLGDFGGASLGYLGVHARMHRGASGEYLMSFSRKGGAERWQAVVERTVGSHRYQQYLAREDDVWLRLPIAWNVEEGRWNHLNGAFLLPDPVEPPAGTSLARTAYDRHVTRWNDNCVFCHNVAPNPGLDPRTDRFDTHVAELGIACEACHGPGSQHVTRNGNPLRRYALHLGRVADPSIAHPGRLDHERSAEVCGRCHGQRIADDIGRFHRGGDPFVPGEPLARYSKPLWRDTPLRGEPGVFANRFWSDGTARLTAYEYQGLLQSPCHARGTLTCESCHAMHESDPAGQLRRDRQGDAACTSCHAELAETHALAEHTRHDPTGPGARCRACHMPDIVYGLVGVRVSHRIESPDPGHAADRPDACTLCHADRTRAWAIAAMERAPAPASDEVPDVTRMLLGGDPIERAVAAHALGSPTSPAPAPPRMGLLLDALVADDYAAVRAIAWRELRRLLASRRASHVPDVAAFTATDSRTAREAQVETLRATLLGSAVEPPDPSLVARLRPLALATAIEIGE